MVTPLIMLCLLVLPYFILNLIPALKNQPSLRGCIGLTLVFLFTGAGHFFTPEPMAQMIPPLFPYRIEIIYITGLVELLAGLLLLPQSTRYYAGLFVIGMLAAFLPFNIYAAIDRVPMGGHAWGPVYLLVRVPLQIVFAVWCYWFAVKKNR